MKKEIRAMENELDVHPRYQILVEDAYQRNLNLYIPNTTLGHAVFLSKLLIEKAKRTIKIYTGELKEIFYNHKRIREDIETATSRGVEISIIVEDIDRVTNQEFLNFAKEQGIKVRALKNVTEVNTHFLLSDTSAFRIEYPHTPNDFGVGEKFKVRGVANFNNADLGKQISSAFSYLINNSEII